MSPLSAERLRPLMRFQMEVARTRMAPDEVLEQARVIVEAMS